MNSAFAWLKSFELRNAQKQEGEGSKGTKMLSIIHWIMSPYANKFQFSFLKMSMEQKSKKD